MTAWIRGKKILLRPMTEKDTENIVRWRNEAFVRENFIYQKPFTAEGHKHWAETMVNTGRAVQFIICTQEEKPVGSVYLRDIDRTHNLSLIHISRTLMILVMVGLIVIFAVKNVFLFFQQKVQLKFVYTNQFATSRRMMINFMERPYEYYLNADTSVIQRSITSDVNNMYGLRCV